ncbi:MAG: oligosaccharide flippase family protein, partial [Bacteroidota bacterium]|nr:oligosaccharide flippase family protein [Bacteroidota bacterium]
KGFSFISLIYNSSYGVGYIFVSNLIASSVTLLLFFPEIFKIKIDFNSKLLKSVLIYSLPLLITGLTGAVNEMADRIFIKYLTVAPIETENVQEYVMSQLGIYGASAKLAVIMMMFVQAFRYAAEPFFFSSAKKLDSDSLKNFADVMKYYIFLAFLMFLIIMQNIDIVKYFINKDYFEGLVVVFPLFLSRILVGVFFILSFWYKLKDLTKYGIVIFSTGAVVTIVMDILLIPKFGYIAAAWTNFATYFVMVVFSFIWSRKYMKVPYQYVIILLYIGIAFTIYYMSVFINTSSEIINICLKNLVILFYIFVFIKVEKISLKKIIIKYVSKNRK